MSASVQAVFSVDLPDGEGTMRALVTSWDKPSPEDVYKTPFINAILVHDHDWGAYGGRTFSAHSVSASKTVLLCESCGLRLTIPRAVDNLGRLREHFTVPTT